MREREHSQPVRGLGCDTDCPLWRAAHMAFGCLALSPMMFLADKYKSSHMNNLRKEWRALLFIGCVNGPQIALNNASLVKIELSLNQVGTTRPTRLRLRVRSAWAEVIP